MRTGLPRSRRATASITRRAANGSPASAIVGGWIRGSGMPSGAGLRPCAPGSAVIGRVIGYPSGKVGFGRLARRPHAGNGPPRRIGGLTAARRSLFLLSVDSTYLGRRGGLRLLL